MPFVSQAQREWMHIHHPEMAEEWESKTPKGKKLPKHVKAAARHDFSEPEDHPGVIRTKDSSMDSEFQKANPNQKRPIGSSEYMGPSQAMEPSEVDIQFHQDKADVTHPGFHREPGYNPNHQTSKDPFSEPYAEDVPYFDVAATDPMRLRKEVLKDMGLDGDPRNPVKGAVRLVKDPRTKERLAVKVNAAYVDAFDGTAENGEGLRAIWSPGENTWVRDNGRRDSADWAPTISHDWS